MRTLNRDERRIVVDALRRAAADTRGVMMAWTDTIPKALGIDGDVARENRDRLGRHAMAQDRLAVEFSIDDRDQDFLDRTVEESAYRRGMSLDETTGMLDRIRREAAEVIERAIEYKRCFWERQRSAGERP